MKKQWPLLLAAALMMGAPSTFVSCGDDDPDPSSKPTDPSNPSNPDDPGSEPGDNDNVNDKKLTSEAQKQKLEQTAREFMAEVPSSEFKAIQQLATDVNDLYVDNDRFDHSVVTDWFEALVNSHRTFDREDSYTYYTDRYYKRLIYLSQFTGSFKANGNKWTKKDASNLEFEFTDRNNQKCVCTLTTSGNVAKVYVGESWDDEYYDKNDRWVSEINNNYLYVPEHISLKLTQGGTTLVSSQVDIDHSQFAGPEYDLSRDALSTSVTAKVQNFTWVVNRLAHNGVKGSAEVNGYMAKGNTKLVTFEGTVADTKLNDDYELVQGGAAKASVDIMGKVQIKGTCSNVKTFVDYLDKANRNEENESTFKSYVNQANSLIDMGMYFDKGKTQQAKMRLDCFEDGWPGYKYWTCEPVLVFDDGSSYSTFEAFFDEVSFRKVIDLFNDLLRGYEDMVDDFE